MAKDKPPDPKSGSRRTAVKTLLDAATTAGVGMMAYPIVRFVLPPEVREAQSVTAVVGQVADFPIKSGKVVRFGSIPALVMRRADGSFLAFNANCTHLSCIVQYKNDTDQIWCACHNGVFDLTGKNISGPPPRPLAPLAVNVVGDDVVVSRA